MQGPSWKHPWHWFMAFRLGITAQSLIARETSIQKWQVQQKWIEKFLLIINFVSSCQDPDCRRGHSLAGRGQRVLDPRQHLHTDGQQDCRHHRSQVEHRQKRWSGNGVDLDDVILITIFIILNFFKYLFQALQVQIF